ncbi:hypothetical protein YC2023_092284 [Brassica napus]
MVAELLDTGNFMFIYSNNSESDDYLWESFNFSTNTLLPQMELRFGSEKTQRNKFLAFRRERPMGLDKFYRSTFGLHLTMSREQIPSFSITTNNIFYYLRL